VLKILKRAVLVRANVVGLRRADPLIAAPMPLANLFRLFNRADHGVEIRPVAAFEFGMKELSIGANFKGAAARRDERERLDPFAEFENFGRQTDGFRRVVSNDAVFDRYFGLHFQLLSAKRLRSRREVVKRQAWQSRHASSLSLTARSRRGRLSSVSRRWRTGYGRLLESIPHFGERLAPQPAGLETMRKV
jgi:hypothetical protein